MINNLGEISSISKGNVGELGWNWNEETQDKLKLVVKGAQYEKGGLYEKLVNYVIIILYNFCQQ